MVQSLKAPHSLAMCCPVLGSLQMDRHLLHTDAHHNANKLVSTDNCYDPMQETIAAGWSPSAKRLSRAS